jgi:hypothetical protein
MAGPDGHYLHALLHQVLGQRGDMGLIHKEDQALSLSLPEKGLPFTIRDDL